MCAVHALNLDCFASPGSLWSLEPSAPAGKSDNFKRWQYSAIARGGQMGKVSGFQLAATDFRTKRKLPSAPQTASSGWFPCYGRKKHCSGELQVMARRVR